jgi:hypothetical protein
MSYRLGESDEAMHYGASRDRNVDGRKSNSRIILRKEGCLFGALFYLVLLGKILFICFKKKKRPYIAVKSFKSSLIDRS